SPYFGLDDIGIGQDRATDQGILISFSFVKHFKLSPYFGLDDIGIGQDRATDQGYVEVVSKIIFV
ncbi:hypothetical protein BMR03_12865, partial [Methylococcaceae bacterium HT2]